MRGDEKALEFKKQRGKLNDKLSSDLRSTVIIHRIKSAII